jgi:hypothetical protein
MPEERGRHSNTKVNNDTGKMWECHETTTTGVRKKKGKEEQ